MKHNLPSNSHVMKFFAYVQMNDIEVIHLGDLQSALGISTKQEQNLLAYMTKKGSIIRLKRGLYIAPQQIPPSGRWQPDPKYLVSCLMEEIKASYYIGGSYAFHYHGLTDQIPNIITIYNDKISGKKKLGVLNAQFIKVAANKIGATSKIVVARNKKCKIATLTRCIVDAVVDYNRYNTLPKAYGWIRERIDQKAFLKELITTTVKYANISAKRRIGFFILSETKDKTFVTPILNTLKSKQGWTPLDPYSESRGTTDKQWRIINNVKQK